MCRLVCARQILLHRAGVGWLGAAEWSVGATGALRCPLRKVLIRHGQSEDMQEVLGAFTGLSRARCQVFVCEEGKRGSHNGRVGSE